MWHTSSGVRVLSPAELAIFVEAAAYLVDQAEECMYEGADNDACTDVPVFNRLTPQQRIMQLAIVLDALTDEMCPRPQLTSVNEGTLGAMVFAFESFIIAEIEMEESSDTRQLLKNLCKEKPKVYGRGPRISVDDKEPWMLIIEVLHDQILHDDDYSMDDYFSDLPVDQAAWMRDRMSIDDAYFTGVAHDPTEKELTWARNLIFKLMAQIGKPVIFTPVD